MLKIHILGGPGSGKTTLAHDLSARFHVPHYDLDQIGWKHGMAPLAAYVEDALTISAQSGWVTEGIYLFWTDPLLHQADYIVLLDIPLTLAVWRVLRRHVSKSLQGTNPYATKFLWPLLKGMHHLYDHSDIPPTDFVRTYLEKYREITEPPVAGFTPEFSRTYLEKYRAFTEPPTEEFIQLYLEQYKDGVEPPSSEFVRMHHQKFRATVEPDMSKTFMDMYLEKYQQKVVLVRNNADRDRLIERLTKGIV